MSDMPWPIKIEIPGMVPPSPNDLRRKYRHWAAYRLLKSSWAGALFYSVESRPATTLRHRAKNGNRMRVDVELYLKRGYDPDNLVGACKPLLDALRQIRFIANDDEKHLVLLVRQFKSREQGDRFYGTRIFIQPA